MLAGRVSMHSIASWLSYTGHDGQYLYGMLASVSCDAVIRVVTDGDYR